MIDYGHICYHVVRHSVEMESKIVISLLFCLSLFSSCKSNEPLAVNGANGGIVIYHTGYTVSFNSDTKIPNWVAYELTAEEAVGTVKRDNGYYPDPDIKAPQADNNDYQNTGWDRGHMAPAGGMISSTRCQTR